MRPSVLTFGFTAAAFAADQTFGRRHQRQPLRRQAYRGQTARACTETCVKGGASYVFVSGGKVYKLEDPSKLVAAHAGHSVNLTGEMKGDTITVAKIEMPNKK